MGDIKMSMADIAKIKYPLVYEASLDIPDGGLLQISDVLGIIIDRYDLDVEEGIKNIDAMAIMESQLESIYLSAEDESPYAK